MTRTRLGMIVVLFCLAVGHVAVRGAEDSGLAQLRSQLVAYFTRSPVDETELGRLVRSLREDGSWPDVDYASQQRGAWATYRHISRVLQMARAYRAPSHRLAGSDELRQAVVAALDHWLEHDYTNPNWWYGRIGVPRATAPILILMDRALPERTRQKAIGQILGRSRMGMTGQNKVWCAGIALMKGLLNEDGAMMQRARDAIFSELHVTTAEGVQADFSFHQHGPQQQWGNYGSSFGSDMIQWATVLRGTRFALQTGQQRILCDYLLEGPAWIVWRGRMDISGCGRQIFPNCQASKGAAVLSQLNALKLLDPRCADRCERVLGSQKADANQLLGHKHYWRSDISVHRRPTWYASVKMSSKRVIGAETCNSENLRGLHLADGVTYFLRSGREYENLFPVWNWRRLPGTTCLQTDGSLVPSGARCRGKTDFVGGVTDGVQGLAAMEYQRDGLEARKSWFFLDDAVVCLGSRIRCSSPERIVTSINQCRLDGAVTVSQRGKTHPVTAERTSLESVDWVIHAGIAYQLLQPGMLEIEQGRRHGDWRQIHDQNRGGKAQADVLSLWIEHPAASDGAGYAYAVYPDASVASMREWQKSPVARILAQSETQHAIALKNGSRVLAAFYEPDRVLLDNGGWVEVDRPCLLMLDTSADRPQVCVSDPTHHATSLHIRIGRKNPHKNSDTSVVERTVQLPRDEWAGQTVCVETEANK